MKRSTFMMGILDIKTLVASQMTENNIHTATENASWHECVRITIDKEITSLPIVDEENNVAGLVTEYDFLRPMEETNNLDTLKAKDIVFKNCQMVTENSMAMEVLKVFIDNCVFKVFVVDEHKLKGVIVKHDVTLADLNSTQEPFKGF